jgi:hypothetical protein
MDFHVPSFKETNVLIWVQIVASFPGNMNKAIGPLLASTQAGLFIDYHIHNIENLSLLTLGALAA